MAQVALKLDRLSAGDLIIFAQSVHTGLTVNAAIFPDLPVTMLAFNTQIAALLAAQEAAITGGPTTKVTRNQKRKIVSASMVKLGRYVNNVADGDPEIIGLANMPLRAVGPRRYDTLATPTNLLTKVVGVGAVEV
ncbi:MAG TPA: hypothetical protein PL009_07850 [Flavipsychrobacter sp.]|nr:hypothetical protein [Flavipsychrobacter sp.]